MRLPQAISAPVLVGRDRQLDLLARALADPPAVVLVEGEAGIGKTRLIREFLASPLADAGPRHALLGTCLPHREQAPLAPVVQALRAATGPARIRLPELALSGLAGALRPLLPEWAAQLSPAPEPLGDPEATRHRLYRALAELIERLRTTVLVLDDVHWADPGTLEFLLFLVSRQQVSNEHSGGLSVVVTYRPEDVSDQSPLRRLSSRRPHGISHTRLTLPLLDVADTTALASSMLGGAKVSEAFAAFLHELTDGLPLAVEESVHLLGDRVDAAQERVRSTLAGLQVPPTIRDSTLERAGRRSPEAQRVLQAAAVLAEPADEATLAAVAGLGTPAPITTEHGTDQATDAIAEAVAVGLLREGPSPQRGELVFRHALSAAAVYEAIPVPQRRRLHLRAGKALARLDPPPAARLARHFRHGGDLARWARWAERAADQATAASDHATATALLEQLPRAGALPVATRVRLAEKLAATALYLQVADAAQVDRVVQSMRRVLSIRKLGAEDRARLRNLLGRLLNQRGEPGAAFVEFARSVPRLRRDPVEAARTMLSLGWPRTGSWPVDVHLRWLRRADRLAAASVKSPVDRISMQVDRATALLQLGAEAGWAAVAELPDTAATSDEWLHLVRGRLNLGDAAMHWGHYERARQLLCLGLEQAQDKQFERLETLVRAALARLDWLTGAWDGLAERVAGPANDPDLAGAPVLAENAILTAGLLAAAQGNPQQAEPPLQWSLDRAGRSGWITHELAPAAALARLRLAEGDVTEALAITDRPMTTLRRKQIWVWATEIAPVRVAALLAAGQPDLAEDLVAAYGAGMRGRDAPAPQAALLTSRAMLLAHHGHQVRAAAGYLTAARAWDALPRPYEALLARERGAHCRLAAGDPDGGVAALEQAGRGLWELGATGDADRVAGALRERGLEVTHRWRRRGYGDQLSPREREVVALVAAGKTNREVARLLVRAPSTVAKQLRSAMRKLGVSSRTALAVRAVENGDLADPASTNGPPDR